MGAHPRPTSRISLPASPNPHHPHPRRRGTLSQATPAPASAPDAPAASTPDAQIEAAFQRKRAELGVRIDFPEAVLREAEEAAKRDPAADASLADLTEIPFITIDPPGSRDLDQALCIQPAEHGGFRLWYAIADVGFFVDRGGAVEREA